MARTIIAAWTIAVAVVLVLATFALLNSGNEPAAAVLLVAAAVGVGYARSKM